MTASTTAVCVNADERVGEQADATERGEQADARDRRREHERQLDERTTSGRPRNRCVASTKAAGVPTSETRAARSTVVFRLTTNASVTTGFASCSTRSAGETCVKIATIGSSEEQQCR